MKHPYDNIFMKRFHMVNEAYRIRDKLRVILFFVTNPFKIKLDKKILFKNRHGFFIARPDVDLWVSQKDYGFEVRPLMDINEDVFVDVGANIGRFTIQVANRLKNNGKVIWFKDVPNILSKSMNLLKAAAETEKVRLITKSNYSTYQQDLPNSFIYTGRMIFDYNELSGISKAAKMDFEALKTRAEYVELNVSNEEIIEVMRKIAKLDWQKEVTEFIVENHLKYGLESVNLRTQTKAFNTFLYSKEKGLDWKVELVRELEIEVSPIRKLLFSLIGNKAVKTSELKKILLKKQIFNSLTSANRRVNEYIEIGELKRWTGGERDFYVSINERQIIYNTE